MTVSTRISAPSYKIFEPDALDAIYAKGNLDPIMGGISYAFGSAHKQEAAGNQADYLASQEKFNKTAAGLDAMEIAQKQKGEILKAATALLGHGAATTDLEPGALAGLYNSQGYRNDTLGNSLRDKMAAEAQHARSGGGGSGGKDYYTIQSPVNLPDGSVGMETVKTFGAPPARTSTGSPDARVINQNIVKAVGAALGPDAKGERTADGGTKWQSPSKPGVVIAFDAQGNAKR